MAEDSPRSEEQRDGGEQEGRYAPECYACPIGTVSMAFQRTAPDTTEHLLRAGREVLLALRGVVDGLNEFLTTVEQRNRSASEASPGIQSIPIRRHP